MYSSWLQKERLTAMSSGPRIRFEATVHTEDEAILNCLRGLAFFHQQTGNRFEIWGSTSVTDWKRDNGNVTFRFSLPLFRDAFVADVLRLFPAPLVTVLNHPA